MLSLSETIDSHIRAFAADQHTSIPATVLAYHPESQTVDVKVAINHLLSSNEVLERGSIKGVPVQFTGTSRSMISFPIKAGDSGMLVFQERSMDEWVTQPQGIGDKKSVHARDRRMHDYSDCVFISGIHPYKQSPVAGRGHTYKHDPNQDVVVKHNIGSDAECYMILKPDGSIVLQNKEVQLQLLVNGTVQIDCKNVVVNSSETVAITTPDFTVDCDTYTVTADTSITETTASATTTATTVSITAAIATTGTITNNTKNIGSTHTHGGVTTGSGTTGVVS